jgi:hypothetical protein
MAAKNPVQTVIGRGDGSCILVQWSGVTEADTCVAVEIPDKADKSVQVAGTFGSATAILEGSNDGTNFSGLRSPDSVAISLTATGLKQVLENTRYVRPSMSGGTGQSLTISMVFNLSNPLRT